MKVATSSSLFILVVLASTPLYAAKQPKAPKSPPNSALEHQAPQEQTCITCYDIITPADQASLPCSHGPQVHQTCLNKWYNMQQPSFACPLCRTGIRARSSAPQEVEIGLITQCVCGSMFVCAIAMCTYVAIFGEKDTYWL